MHTLATSLVVSGLAVAIAVYGAVLGDNPALKRLTDTPTGQTSLVNWQRSK
jgi:hypothetical protein